eukprot:613534-Prymnesium_polylepis.1
MAPAGSARIVEALGIELSSQASGRAKPRRPGAPITRTQLGGVLEFLKIPAKSRGGLSDFTEFTAVEIADIILISYVCPCPRGSVTQQLVS